MREVNEVDCIGVGIVLSLAMMSIGKTIYFYSISGKRISKKNTELVGSVTDSIRYLSDYSGIKKYAPHLTIETDREALNR